MMRLPRFTNGTLVNADQMNAFVAELERLLPDFGDGFIVEGGILGRKVSVQAIFSESPEALPTMFGKITGCADGVYTFAEAIYTPGEGETPGGWTAKTGGKSGDCYNLEELLDLGAGITIDPVAVDSIVAIWPIKVTGDATRYYFGSSQWLYGSDGALTALAATHATRNTDTWSVLTNPRKGVSYNVVTDISYSTTTHRLTYRMRTLTYDKRGRLRGVSAESDPLTLIEQAVPLPD